MSIHFKAATLVLGIASLFAAGQANAAACDGTVQQTRTGRTVQCYYLPTVSNGRISGQTQVVNYDGTDNRYGGAVIGGHPYRPTYPRH